jgi:hypothetical protein
MIELKPGMRVRSLRNTYDGLKRGNEYRVTIADKGFEFIKVGRNTFWHRREHFKPIFRVKARTSHD